MPKFRDITGERFGRLIVIQRHGKNKHRNILWRCKCDCGNEHTVLGKILAAGKSRSCGCLPRHDYHGATEAPEWNSWICMIKRCRYGNNKDYKNYGGRGITVCERWLKYPNFIADMGPRPEGHTLDRIDPNGNYEPNNCRWATPKQQANNRRRFYPRLLLRRWDRVWDLRHANDNPSGVWTPSGLPLD